MCVYIYIYIYIYIHTQISIRSSSVDNVFLMYNVLCGGVFEMAVPMDTPKSSKSFYHYSIETHGFGDSHFRKHPYIYNKYIYIINIYIYMWLLYMYHIYIYIYCMIIYVSQNVHPPNSPTIHGHPTPRLLPRFPPTAPLGARFCRCPSHRPRSSRWRSACSQGGVEWPPASGGCLGPKNTRWMGC